ncbi:MAG: polysaccharide deacetylase family protein [Clostridia bacterium]|nr:polysaccharide deacetylase family protein [Clostridia bacterium]
MIQFNLFPGGVRRVVTFSYDDGSENDVRLVELFNKYGVKGSFHLNAGKYKDMGDEELDAIEKLYIGHEISCHTVNHGWLTRMPYATATRQVLEDRMILEKIAKYPVRGMSYPSGDYNEKVCEILSACGIEYSRTTKATMGATELPEKPLMWHPTCHHKDALPIAEKFMEELDSQWRRPLLYIWGHAHELRTEDDWAYMEKLVSTLARSEKIWYATNIEIIDYMNALRMLRISADEKILQNPTGIDLWVELDKKENIKIPAGETVRLA